MLEAGFICQRGVVKALLENSIYVAVTILAWGKISCNCVASFQNIDNFWRFPEQNFFVKN
ncbi:hypothetical protein NIES4072_45990 [Nostoc commune NIES-4072]|uniref:Uncharacterized protein n=1 Tax=Nostoc commune NIES-4072 TaxID=2005467 RepID=A0A2R5FQ84_NOSCO|nr:hypothetical protein NIES4070_44840 [Nostoc commune HK-02]GBG20917.1 hypothetical protein NIES4072_45990 [Nostoc commune NIES-4072]